MPGDGIEYMEIHGYFLNCVVDVFGEKWNPGKNRGRIDKY